MRPVDKRKEFFLPLNTEESVYMSSECRVHGNFSV